jgi:hypothetical protein
MAAVARVVRGLVPMTAAFCAVGLMSTAAWASPPAPHPAPAPAPAPVARQIPPPLIRPDECTQRGGRPVPDPRNPRVRHCEGGPFHGREIR